jgi:hypothetical protein
VEPDRLLGLEHRDLGMFGERGRRRQAGDPAADDENI